MKMKILIPLFSLIISWGMGINSFAKLISYNLSEQKKFTFPFQDVCPEVSFSNSFLIFTHGNKLDCAGKMVELDQFCRTSLKEKKTSGYVRALIASTEKNITCQRASKVSLQFACETSAVNAKDYCEDALMGCQKLKNTLVKDLKITHSNFISSLTSENEKILDCIYIDASFVDLNVEKTEILIKNSLF